MAQKNSFDPFHISALVVKMINTELTLTEQAELNEWLAEDPQNHALIEKLLDKNLWSKDVTGMNAFDSDAALKAVLEKINKEQNEETPRHKKWPYLSRYVAAAVMLLSIASVFYFLNTKSINQPQLQAKRADVSKKDLNKVMLTLADGTSVEVGAAPAKQGVAVLTAKNGTLSYAVDESKANEPTTVAYNMLSVPKGKQYQITLPDGTEVWLNSYSTLKYPVVFNGAERVVELTGEAYFEVEHLDNTPFKVKSNRQIVEVLGTHFNIEAYPDDQKITTTLAEGSVRIMDGKLTAKLKPGQMAVNVLSSATLAVQPANVMEALAWKNGIFSFSDDRLEDIMKKVARSYDVDIEFQGNVKDKKIWGTYPRHKGLGNLLKNLEQTKEMHFKRDGRRIVVMP